MKLLYVHGNQKDRNVLRYAHKQDNHSVTVVDNGRDAYKSFLSEDPDMMIMDIDITDIDVPKLIKTIRNINKSDIPILLLLQPDQMHMLEPAMRNGANNFLVSPFSEAVFQRTLGMHV